MPDYDLPDEQVYDNRVIQMGIHM